jgi:hypothetical protein
MVSPGLMLRTASSGVQSLLSYMSFQLIVILHSSSLLGVLPQPSGLQNYRGVFAALIDAPGRRLSSSAAVRPSWPSSQFATVPHGAAYAPSSVHLAGQPAM